MLLAALSATAVAAGWTLGPELREHAWLDSDGRELRLSTLRSPLIVMTMAYTACRRVCATTTLTLSEMQKRLDAMKLDADFVVVSYDPQNDSPQQWRDYRSRRNLDRDNWHFLSSDENSTRKLARGLDLSFWIYHDHIVHDFRIVLFDSQWRQVGEVGWTDTDRLDSILTRAAAAVHSPAPLS
jgi:cytochrome oxidase Cu insertion factor (SCO1/SenC/PrrC family)